jgi:predicted metal-dependent hydrolase
MTNSSEHSLKYGTTTIAYTLTYAERETLAIHVHPDNQVTVDAPLDSELADVEKRVRKRAAWIIKQQRNFRRYSVEFPPRQYVSGETHRYLGRQYQLKVIQEKNGLEKVKMDRGRIHVFTRDKSDQQRVKKLLDKWYRTHARRVFTERVEEWYPRFKRFEIEQPLVVLRQMKSRWGSCTEAGKITLNVKLIQVPKQFIDYVIVHELCHLVQHNHSSGFYSLMSRIMPDWEERRGKLNSFEF